MRHVLRVSCHFKTRSRGGVIIYDKRILCSFPTMRRIQTFITRYQDLQDAFARHAPISRRVRKTRQDAKIYKTPRPTRRIRMARSHFKTRSEKTRQDVFVHNKTPRPTRRIRKAHSHFKTCWEKQDKTYSCITRRQDLQEAFERHAPISRRVQKTRQDVFVHNKTPRPTRRIRTARSHFKTRSENKTRRIRA